MFTAEGMVLEADGDVMVDRLVPDHLKVPGGMKRDGGGDNDRDQHDGGGEVAGQSRIGGVGRSGLPRCAGHSSIQVWVRAVMRWPEPAG